MCRGTSQPAIKRGTFVRYMPPPCRRRALRLALPGIYPGRGVVHTPQGSFEPGHVRVSAMWPSARSPSERVKPRALSRHDEGIGDTLCSPRAWWPCLPLPAGRVVTCLCRPASAALIAVDKSPSRALRNKTGGVPRGPGSIASVEDSLEQSGTWIRAGKRLNTRLPNPRGNIRRPRPPGLP